MKEMMKVEMTYLFMSGVVIKYKSSQNTYHCKIMLSQNIYHCIFLDVYKIHIIIIKVQVKSIWVFTTYDLDSNIVAIRLSQILSIDMLFVIELESSDVF
jgi:hypothetical protein